MDQEVLSTRSRLQVIPHHLHCVLEALWLGWVLSLLDTSSLDCPCHGSLRHTEDTARLLEFVGDVTEEYAGIDCWLVFCNLYSIRHGLHGLDGGN